MGQKPVSVFLFPGMNSLLKKGDRFRYLGLGHVQKRISQAEEILRQRKQFRSPLQEHLERPTQEIYSLENLHYTTILINCIQLGVADCLADILPDPEWVVGCSLGDIARSIYAGGIDFADVLQLINLLAGEKAGVEQLGACIVLLNPGKFEPAELRWMEGLGIGVCRLSDRRLLLAGSHPALAAVRARADEKRWKSLFLIDCPFHSACLIPHALRLESAVDAIPFRDPQRRIFSSVLLRPISTAQELRMEQKLSLIQPFDWYEATRRLVRDIGVTRFVNIGPCQSLVNLIREIAPDQEVLDAADLIEMGGAGEMKNRRPLRATRHFVSS